MGRQDDRFVSVAELAKEQDKHPKTVLRWALEADKQPIRWRGKKLRVIHRNSPRGKIWIDRVAMKILRRGPASTWDIESLHASIDDLRNRLGDRDEKFDFIRDIFKNIVDRLTKIEGRLTRLENKPGQNRTKPAQM